MCPESVHAEEKSGEVSMAAEPRLRRPDGASGAGVLVRSVLFRSVLVPGDGPRELPRAPLFEEERLEGRQADRKTMPIVSETCKEEIRGRVTLEEVVRDYNIQLTPSGKRLKGLCPFHAEKTPSFHIDPEKQFYYCFGCQAAGDVFRFVQAMHQVDFPQALEILARRAGIELVYEGGRQAGSERKTVLDMYDALQAASGLYHRFLLEDRAAAPARDYLKKRRIDPAQWERFGLGYAPPERDWLVRRAERLGATPEILERVGLARTREGGGIVDYFRGRLLFPIADVQGRVIGFGGRTLGDDVPKYLNTPRTPLFDKSQVLYGLPQAKTGIKREGRIGIVEGYTDVIMAHQNGLDFFVASLGTAFTAENARKLGRLAPRALLIFDGDDAGQRASERSLHLLVAENLDVRIHTVRDGKDPCDAILALGGEEFRKRFDSESVDIFEFKWQRTAGAGGSAAVPALKAKALDEFLELLALVPNVVLRKLYVRTYSERIGVSERDIEARLNEVVRSRGGRGTAARRSPAGFSGEDSPSSKTSPGGSVEGDETQEAARIRALEEVTLECLFALGHRAREIWSRVPSGLFAAQPLRSIGQAVARHIEELGDDFPGGRLASELLGEIEDSEAARLIAGVLGRIEDVEGEPARDYEEVWSHLERDFGRFAKGKRVREIERLMAEEKTRGRAEELFALRREYLEALREQKKG